MRLALASVLSSPVTLADMHDWFPLLQGISALLLFTAFIKIATTLVILRQGIGVQGGGFGVVIVAVSGVLAVVMVEPQLRPLGGVEKVLTSSDSSALQEAFRPYLEKHVDEKFLARLSRAVARNQTPGSQSSTAAGKHQDEGSRADESSTGRVQAVVPGQPNVAAPEPPTTARPFLLLVAAFVLGELQQAFSLGVMLLIPFVVVDLLVVNALAALGVSTVPAAVLSFPLKLMLFVAVDGWNLIGEKLLGG